MAKLIKRLFISDVGSLILKVDYSAHEVRGWSIISGDKEVAGVFQTGADLRKQYRFVPDPYLGHRIEIEGDVHKINAAYFFGIPIAAVTKAIRNAVKTVVFGLIYQQGNEGLAESTGRPVEEIEEIKTKFLDRFPTGLKWFDKIKKSAKRDLFVESPLGRRRNLPALLVAESLQGARSVINRSLRQCVNSPVQGFGSDLMMSSIRLINKYCYEYYVKHGVYPHIKADVSVHDSLSVETGYEWTWLAIDFIERAMTTGVVELMQERHGIEFTSIPEIEFEIGADESTTKTWDYSVSGLRKILTAGVIQRRDTFKEKVDVDKVVDSIMNDQWEHMPMWAKKQYEANAIPCRSKTETVLSKAERKQAATLIKERDTVNKKKHANSIIELIEHTEKDEDKNKLRSSLIPVLLSDERYKKALSVAKLALASSQEEKDIKTWKEKRSEIKELWSQNEAA